MFLVFWFSFSFRVGILKEQKDQQKSDLNNLEDLRSTLGENTERLAVECEECKEKQEEILKRLVVNPSNFDRLPSQQKEQLLNIRAQLFKASLANELISGKKNKLF